MSGSLSTLCWPGSLALCTMITSGGRRGGCAEQRQESRLSPTVPIFSRQPLVCLSSRYTTS